ncbi:MAG: CDP-glycerol glycerophosphotransferase family protein, partial [Tetragenococcus koreensis]|nr:CDP-glycerol glycerophosphotransferase family protein [Tetragenococcus koreensis]
KEFLALLEKWGEQMPECTFSNLNNFLKSLERSTSFFNECDLDLIQKEYFPFKNKVLSSIPTSYKNRYEKAFLRFEKKIGFEPTPHSLIYKKILSRVGEYKLKTRALNILEKNIPIIDGMIPKRKNVWIFTSWGNYEQHTIDNPRAVFEEAKNDKKIKKIIILNKSSKLLKKGSTSPDVKFIPLHSIKGLFSLMSAGYIFTGYSLHNIFGYRKILSKNRKIVQLWHGIPIKKIGLQVNKGQEPFWKKELPRYHASIAASQLDMQTMIKSFSPSLPEKIKLTGLPRHDFLSKDENELPQDYQQHLKILRNRVNGRKLVLFAPTWREKNQTPCIFTNKQFAQLDSAMKENNAVLAVRLHRNMMKKNTFSSFISNNIFYVNDFPDVNILLREANLLITDYSSIFLDFIKLERKIILYTVDLNDYMSSRGLNYNCEDFLPEKNFICHFDSLIIELNNHFVNGFKTDSRYNSVKHKFHEFELDSNNARRVIDAVL